MFCVVKISDESGVQKLTANSLTPSPIQIKPSKTFLKIEMSEAGVKIALSCVAFVPRGNKTQFSVVWAYQGIPRMVFAGACKEYPDEAGILPARCVVAEYFRFFRIFKRGVGGD